MKFTLSKIILIVLPVVAAAVALFLGMNGAFDLGTAAIARPESDEITAWETFGIPEWNFEVRYPGTDLVASCPVYASCYLGSPFLDGERYYSSDDLPESALLIDIKSFGSEEATGVANLERWLRSQSETFDEKAMYDVVSVGGGYSGLREVNDDHETIYVATGSGRVLAFEVIPNTEASRILFEKIVSTIRVGTF